MLRVTGFPVAISVLLAPMAARLKERHPRLSVRIAEAEVTRSFDLLFEGAVDLAVVESTPANPPLSDSRFDQQPLLDDPFDLVVPAGHPLAGPGRIDLAEAAREPWIVPVADSPAGRMCWPRAARPASPRTSSTTPATGTSPPSSSPTASASP
ncbi:hypothetical protein SHKM778_54080 [Streptomyces sp. KM77-8]|uniref:LysR substrate-binding domain-containing protein n=1 Tax=Streptomyces haneummycinicus TaxID=3074435 RepID=A0AAT9HNM8_9ACTN